VQVDDFVDQRCARIEHGCHKRDLTFTPDKLMLAMLAAMITGVADRKILAIFPVS
jgi:hypothetical protein